MADNDGTTHESCKGPMRMSMPLRLLLGVSFVAVILVLCERRPILRDAGEKKASNGQVQSAWGNHSPSAAQQPIWTEDDTVVLSLQLSPDDSYLAAIVGPVGEFYPKRVLLIERRTGAVLVDTPSHFRVRTCFTQASDALLVYAPDSYPFTGATRGVVSVYSAINGTKTTEIDVTGPGGWQGIDAIGVSWDGRTLAVLPITRVPESRKAWDLETRQPVAFEEGAYLWNGAGLSPNGELYSMGGWPGPGVRIRRFGTDQLVSFCLRDALPAVPSSFSDNNRLWATAYDDGVFTVWDIQERQDSTGKVLFVKNGFNRCTAFALSHDLKQLAFAENDGTIRISPLDLP
jgi:WD40 repeat protein